MQSSWTQPSVNLFGSILRSLLRIQIRHSRTLLSGIQKKLGLDPR